MIDRCGGIISTADRTVECHDKCDHAVDLLGGLLLICLDIPHRIGANEYIVCHPAHDGMPAVRYFLFQGQLHQLLGWWSHILEALPERNNGETHPDGQIDIEISVDTTRKFLKKRNSVIPQRIVHFMRL